MIFWKLRKSGFLTTETSDFVPRFAALILIYKNQKLFDLEKEIIKTEILDTQLITINHPVNIHRLSKITGLPVKEIRDLNPELKRNITPPHFSRYTLRLPVNVLKKIDENPNNPIIMQYTRL